MPTLRVNGATLYYEEQGAGPETIVFAHGFLWSCRLYDKQVAEMKHRYRCVAFDFRGQGRSEVTRDGYDMETLYEDTAGLIQALNCAPCHFVGLSMGGFVGIRLAARRPELIKSLTLLDTSADPEPPESLARYKRYVPLVRWFGLRLAAGQLMPAMFGQKFLKDPARAEERREWRWRILSNRKIGATRAGIGVATRRGVQDELGKIRAPTLIVVGDQDVALPPENSQRLHEGILGSRLVIIPGAGHTPTVEEPDAVNGALLEFLNGIH